MYANLAEALKSTLPMSEAQRTQMTELFNRPDGMDHPALRFGNEVIFTQQDVG